MLCVKRRLRWPGATPGIRNEILRSRLRIPDRVRAGRGINDRDRSWQRPRNPAESVVVLEWRRDGAWSLEVIWLRGAGDRLGNHCDCRPSPRSLRCAAIPPSPPRPPILFVRLSSAFSEPVDCMHPESRAGTWSSS
jgi:hypothetical protein